MPTRSLSAERKAPPQPRHSASLIVLRDADDGIEVLMLRRAERAGDQNSGAAVFPGGLLDAGPTNSLTHSPTASTMRRASALLGRPSGGLDYWVAAIRECFEEAGLLLAVDAGGAAGSTSTAIGDDPVLAMRHGLHAGRVDLADAVRAPRAGGWPPIACTTSATG